jgi:hypothetical protein
VLSVDPDAGAPIPGSHPGLRDYRDDVDDVRVIYFVTALHEAASHSPLRLLVRTWW